MTNPRYLNVAAKALLFLAIMIAAVHLPSHGATTTFINLTPAQSDSRYGSSAFGVSGPTQVGSAFIGGANHAGLWLGTAASFVDLHPAAGGHNSSEALAVNGSQQVGYVEIGDSSSGVQGHAAIWSGTANSFVDLQLTASSYYASRAEGTTGSKQVGTVYPKDPGTDQHAALWSGSAGSFIDLHPPGVNRYSSRAHAVSGSQQGGTVLVQTIIDGSIYLFPHAALWSGSAASFVDLNPSGAVNSEVFALDAQHQAGTVYFGGGRSPPHAALWSGTAASFVDLNPAGAISSEAKGTSGPYQVGYVTFPSGRSCAALWSGTAASFVDLNAVLGPDYEGPYDGGAASGVWSDGSTTYVVGDALSSSLAVGPAILWTLREGTGIDVSDAQGFIDWSLVANAGKTFAFVKATSGLSGNDASFLNNMGAGTAAGLKLGAYHFAYPGYAAGNTGIAEAQHFLSIARGYIDTGFLRPALDIEDATQPQVNNPGAHLGIHGLSQWIRDFAQEVKRQTGVEIILYCTRDYARNYLEADLNSYAYWVVTNDNDPTGTPVDMGIWDPTQSKTWTVKQYRYGTDALGNVTATCPGVLQGTGGCDLDSLNGALNSLIIGAPPQPSFTGIGGSSLQPPINGIFQMQVSAPRHQQVTIQASEDLGTWTDVAAVPITTGTGTFTDTQAGTHSRRFYRAKP